MDVNIVNNKFCKMEEGLLDDYYYNKYYKKMKINRETLNQLSIYQINYILYHSYNFHKKDNTIYGFKKWIIRLKLTIEKRYLMKFNFYDDNYKQICINSLINVSCQNCKTLDHQTFDCYKNNVFVAIFIICIIIYFFLIFYLLYFVV